MDPIVVWKGYDIIVDGHHRYEICKRLQIPYGIREVEFEDREAVKQWMLEHQLVRRNLNNFQRAELVLRYKDVLSAQAKQNQRAAGGALPMKSAKPVDTRAELALRAGVSPDTIGKVEKF